MTNRQEVVLFTKFDDAHIFEVDIPILVIDDDYYRFNLRKSSLGDYYSIEPYNSGRTKYQIEAKPYFGGFVDSVEELVEKFKKWKNN